MDIKKYTRANREAWNEVTPIHREVRKVNLKEKFKEKGFSTLDELISSKLKQIPIDGKKVAQLCCNNGRETLSMVNLGAESAVGFDISDEAIKEARELAEISGLNCRFIRTDVYDIGEEYFDTFDLIFITIGALPWLPDLDRFFDIVSKMLKKEGTLLIYEEHPFVYMLATEKDGEFDPENPMKLAFSYFREEPWIDNTGIDYIGKTVYRGKTSYSFSQKLSDVINPIIRSGMKITEFSEYNHNISDTFEHIENQKIMPLSYVLMGRKEK